MFCERCGAELQPNMTFCPKCGAPVHKSQQAAQEEQTPQTQQVSEVQPAEQPQQAAQAEVEEQTQYQQTAQTQAEEQTQYQQTAQTQTDQQTQYQQASQAQYQQYAQTQSQQSSQAADYFKRLFEAWKLVLRDPAGMGKKFVESADVKLACGFIVIQAILSGLFGLLADGQTIGKLIGAFGSSDSMKGVYGKVFFGTLVFSLLFQLILAGLIYLAMMIGKNLVDFKQALVLASLRSLTLAPVILVSMIVLLINPAAGCFVFFAGSVWGLILISIDLPITDQSRNGLIYFLLFVAVFITMVIKVLLMVRVGARFYAPASYIEDLTDILKGNIF